MSSGRPKHRTLCALLASRANRTVPIDAIVAELWTGRPPEAAVANVRTYVAAVRAALGPGYRGRLRTTLSGYLLSLTPEETDLGEIDALRAAARRAIEAGRLDEAEVALDAAVAVVDRGVLLEDVPLGDTLTVLRDAFEEQSVVLREQRFAVKFEVGHAPSIIGELRAHVEAYPLRESAYGWLMRARHAAGGAAEALEVYRLARDTLRHELGIDPSPDLAALHRSILRGDAPEPGIGAGTGASAAVRPRTAPRMLPRDIVDFVGRPAELRAVADALHPSDRNAVVALHGPGGVGKSAIMIRAAHDSLPRYPDGQLYVDMRASSPGERPISVGEALGRLLRALSVDPVSVPDDEVDAVEVYQALLADRRILVLVDNASRAEAVEPLIPRGAGSALLVTSRISMTSLNGAVQIPVQAFPPADAAVFLRTLGGTGEHEPAIDEVAELCGRLALPMRVTAARRSSRPDWTYADLAARLADASGRLAELDHGEVDVGAILRVSYDALADSARSRERDSARALRVMGMLPFTSVTAPLLAAVTGTDGVNARRALDGLVTARLADASQGRWSTHDLTRLLAIDIAATAAQAERAEVVTRAFAWYLDHAEAAAAMLNSVAAGDQPVPHETEQDHEIGSAADAIAFLDDERAQLVAITEIATDMPGNPAASIPDRFVERIRDSVTWQWSRQGYWPDEQRIAELAVACAARDGARPARADALLALARVEGRRRRFADAVDHLTQAARLCDNDPDRRLSCEAELGLVTRFSGDYPTALVHLTRALELCRVTGSPARKEAVVLLNMAMTLGALGDLPAELSCLERSLAIRVEIDDRRGEALVHVALGPVLASLGHWDRAAASIERGILLCDELAMPIDGAYARTFRSVIHLRAGRATAALADADAAFTTLQPIGDLDFLARVHLQLARAHHALGHHRHSVTEREQATRLRAQSSTPPMADMDLFFAECR